MMDDICGMLEEAGRPLGHKVEHWRNEGRMLFKAESPSDDSFFITDVSVNHLEGGFDINSTLVYTAAVVGEDEEVDMDRRVADEEAVPEQHIPAAFHSLGMFYMHYFNYHHMTYRDCARIVAAKYPWLAGAVLTVELDLEFTGLYKTRMAQTRFGGVVSLVAGWRDPDNEMRVHLSRVVDDRSRKIVDVMFSGLCFTSEGGTIDVARNYLLTRKLEAL